MKLIRLAAIAWSWIVFLGSASAQPVVTPDMAVMNLDDLGVYTVGYAYRGQAVQQFPLGWSGYFEDRTGVACEPFGTQNGERAFLLHCPWRNGTGISFQQYAFNLPTQATRILLRGATAIRSQNVTNSDGVTFRLYANGSKLFDYHQTNDTWKPFEYDFTAQRGSNLIVRFEVDPGPNNNPSFDFSLWGNRELVLEGYTPTVLTRPVPRPLALSNLWSGATAEVAPPSGFPGAASASLSNGVARFRYAGPDGTLEYQWTGPQSTNDGLFGTLTLNAQMAGDTPVTVPLANSASLSWSQAASPTASGWLQTNLGYTLWRTFNVGSTSATVRITGQMVGKSLALSVTCDQPRVTAFDLGAWGPVVRRRQVAVPYYPGAVYWLSQENLFVNALLDWTASAATSQNGSKASYEPRTDGSRAPLRERAVFTAAWHLAEVLPESPKPAVSLEGFSRRQSRARHLGRQFHEHREQPDQSGQLRDHPLRCADPQLAAQRLRQRPPHALPGELRLRRRSRNEQPRRHRRAAWASDVRCTRTTWTTTRTTISTIPTTSPSTPAATCSSPGTTRALTSSRLR